MADKLVQHQIDKHKVESALSRLASLTTDPDVQSSCMLYPDTAPRTTWRPQMYAWMKKNYPQKLREISQASVAPLHPLSSDPSHHYDTTSPPRRAGSVGSAGSSAVSGSHRRLSHENKPYSRPQNDDHHDPSMILTASSSSATSASSSSSSYSSTTQEHNAQNYSYSHTQSTSAYANPANLPFTTSAKLPSPPQSPELSPNSRQDHKTTPSNNNHHHHHPHHQNSNYTFSVKMGSNSYHHRRRCISCGSDQSPCWRPSWSPSAGQLCNSCGLRYKKTGARCTSPSCGRIPAKGEWVMMKRNATATGQDPPEYHCLSCGGHVAVGETL